MLAFLLNINKELNMKFSNLKPEQQACLAWISALINDAGTIFFTQCSGLMGSYPWLPHDNPVDNLKHVLMNWTLDPTWERYGSFIQTTNFDYLGNDTVERLNAEGDQFLQKLAGGWSFKFQFNSLSCGVELHTTDEELAKELIGLIVTNMATDDYKAAAGRKNDNMHVYANKTRRCIYVANEKEHRQLQGKEVTLDHEAPWLDYAFDGKHYLGARNLVNMSDAVSTMHQ
mgnify:CR=1 FL=1